MSTTVRHLKAILSADDQASATFARVEKSVRRLGTAFQAVAASAVVGAVVRGIQDSIRAAAEAEMSAKKLETAYRNLGGNLEQNMQRSRRFAAELQRTTTIEDDAAIAAQSLLVSIGRLSGDGLERATRAAADLAAATGVDLQSAAMLLAKASAGNTQALSRYGIVLDETIPKSEKFAAALTMIERNMGGAAAATRETTEGALTAFKNALGNLKEAYGRAFVESNNLTTEINNLAFVMDTANETMGEGGGRDNFLTALARGAAAAYDPVSQLGIALYELMQSYVAFARLQASLVLPPLPGAQVPGVPTAEDLGYRQPSPSDLERMGPPTPAGMKGRASGETFPGYAPEDTALADLQRFMEFEQQKTDFLREQEAARLALVAEHAAEVESLQAAMLDSWVADQQAEVRVAEAAAAAKIQVAAYVAQSVVNLLAAAFGDNKMIAIASAIISTYEGAAKALAQGGIFGYAAAAAIITQGLRYVATMRETEIGGRFAASGGGGGKGSGPKKFAEGGIVPGFDMGYDTVPALLRPGEAVLTPEQFATLARGGGGGGVEIHLHGSLPALVTEVNKAVRGRQVRLYASDTFTSRTAR